jgi:hypothetical protein
MIDCHTMCGTARSCLTIPPAAYHTSPPPLPFCLSHIATSSLAQSSTPRRSPCPALVRYSPRHPPPPTELALLLVAGGGSPCRSGGRSGRVPVESFRLVSSKTAVVFASSNPSNRVEIQIFCRHQPNPSSNLCCQIPSGSSRRVRSWT